jgi:hypothetical protein
MTSSGKVPFISIIISNMSSEQTFQLVNESVSFQLAAFYENIAKESAVKAVLKCAEMYGFDGDEAIQRLGLTSQKVNLSKPAEASIPPLPLEEPVPAPVPVLITQEPVQEPAQLAVVKKGKQAKAPPTTKPDKKTLVISKPAFPLPYNGERNEDLCCGLVLNDALFTQCPSFPKDGAYCSKCAKQCSTNEYGKPTYGTIQDRQQVGIMEYVDPKNRVPVEYVKVMNKYKVSREDVLAEAGKHNMTIDPIHFEIADKKKGRPKNPTTRVVENTSEPDLFKDLISSSINHTPVESSLAAVAVAPAATKASNNAKDVEKQRKLEEEKKQKEEEKQRKLEEKKQKEEEKQRKLDEKKQKEEKKKQKEAPKKKAAAPKKNVAAAKTETTNISEPTPTPLDDANEFEVPDTIVFNYNGKEYHRSIETNNVYSVNPEDGYANVVGRYDVNTKTIIYSDSKLFEDEESEESYDEDDYGGDADADDYDDLMESYDLNEMLE